MSTTTDVTVIGAGAVGVATAWRCAQRGLRVTVVDPDPTRGAWRTAAGLLAPVTELHYAETELLALNLAAARGYPDFVAELADLTGADVNYRATGTLAVAWDAADLASLRDLHAFGASIGVEASLLSGAELRSLEPALAAGLPGGLLAAGDHQVDPRLVQVALVEAASRAGVVFVAGTARVRTHRDRVVGVTTDAVEIDADTVVLAAGAWSGEVDGLPGELRPPTRPVKGQTLRLMTNRPISRVVRGMVAGVPVYLVPRPDGRIVIGATVEEAGFDLTSRAGAVYELLRDAQTVVPELGEATLEEVCTALRPGSPDNAPIIGGSGSDGLVVATGHYRNGILLAPITAAAVAELVEHGALPDSMAAFAPSRFTAKVSA